MQSPAGMPRIEENRLAVVDERRQGVRIRLMGERRHHQHDEVGAAHGRTEIGGHEIDGHQPLLDAARRDPSAFAQRIEALGVTRVQARLAAFNALRPRLDAVRARLQPAQRDGFFQLVDYPLRAAALANERFFALEAGRAEAAWHADLRLKALTARYNAGRWAGILAEEPADSQWPRFRQPKPALPALDTGPLRARAEADLDKSVADAFAPVTAPAPQPFTVEAQADDAWLPLTGFGRGDRTLRALRAGAALSLKAAAHEGPACLSVHLLPTYPGDGASPWVLTLQPSGAVVELPRRDQDAAWALGVLDNRLTARWTVPAGPLNARLTTASADLLFDGAELQDRPCPESR